MHSPACPCDVCLRVRADVAALLVQLPIERRHGIALEAVAVTMPRMVACSGGCSRGMVAIAGTNGLVTRTCVPCGGRGTVPAVQPQKNLAGGDDVTRCHTPPTGGG